MSKKGVETVLHSFGSGLDGAAPYAALAVVSGKLYGTTTNGGKSGAGTAFSITTSGIEKILVKLRRRREERRQARMGGIDLAERRPLRHDPPRRQQSRQRHHHHVQAVTFSTAFHRGRGRSSGPVRG